MTKRSKYKEKKVQQDEVATVRYRPRTAAQGRYLDAIDSSFITFGLGPAGTGKTFCAVAYATRQLVESKISRIVVTRPTVEVGESLGFLPGELEDKYNPYIEPIRDILEELIGYSYVEYLLKHKRIVASPLGFMRGKTFNDSIVLLDEAQNTNPEQMKMFLTRMGRNSKLIINGDEDQSDIRGLNGLTDATRRLKDLAGVSYATFERSDIVRHDLIQAILDRY